MRKLLAAVLLMLSCAVHAQAQSICPQTAIQGYVLTPGQWSACWSAKQDALGYSPVNRNGDTMNGRLVTYPPATTAGFNLTPGSAPGSPANGDVWATSTGMYGRVGSATYLLTGNWGRLRFYATGVNFNTSGDTTIAIKEPPNASRFQVESVRISGASGTLTTATAGAFTTTTTCTGSGGTAIASDQAVTVSTSAEGTVNNSMKLTINNADTQSYLGSSVPNICFRIGTPEGSARTADVTVTIIPLP